MREQLNKGAHGALPVAVGIVLNILSGPGAAYARGIIHRDLKPENVFLLEDPQPRRIRLKLLDFGIALAVGGPNDPNTLQTVSAREGKIPSVGRRIRCDPGVRGEEPLRRGSRLEAQYLPLASPD